MSKLSLPFLIQFHIDGSGVMFHLRNHVKLSSHLCPGGGGGGGVHVGSKEFSVLYSFYTVHYGKLLKKRPTDAPAECLFPLIYSHLHVSVPCGGLHAVHSHMTF